MRSSRYTLKGEGYYYLRMEPLVGRLRLTGEERDVLMDLVAQVSGFTGVEVLECVALPTGIQLVVRANPEKREALDSDELVARFRVLYGDAMIWHGLTAGRLEQLLSSGGEKAERAQRELRALMEDVSQMMKIMKQRYSVWYNRRHRMRGSVWAERFQSVLLDPKAETVGWFRALAQTAPVRAGEVADPTDYRWSTAAPEGWQGSRQFPQSPELQEWTAHAVEEARAWMLAPDSQVERIEAGRCPPEKLEATVTGGIIVGSEDFVRHHHTQWKGMPRAVPIEDIGIPLWAARGWRRRFLEEDPASPESPEANAPPPPL